MAGQSGKGSRKVTRRSGDTTALLPYLMPLIVVLSVFPVAAVTHWRWGSDTLMSALVGVASVLLTGVTWSTWSRRHQHTRLAATWFAGLVFGWVTVATAIGPTTEFALNAWAFGGACLWIMWMIRHAAYAATYEQDTKTPRTDPLFGVISSLFGGKSTKITKKNGRVEAEIQLDKDSARTAADVQRETDHIASVAGMGKDQVTASRVPGDESRVVVAFSETETLRKSVEWEGASAPGKSIAYAPLRLGRRADGKPLPLWIVGNQSATDPRQLPHTILTGVNGSGKTATWITAIVDMRWRTDVVPIVAGPAGKTVQDFRPVFDALGMVVIGKAKVTQFLRNLPDAIEYRQALFGELTRSDGTIGYSQWEPEVYAIHGLPLLSIDLEEATDFLDESNEDWDEAVRKARSAGIALTCSMQTAIHTNISRKTRGQFTNSLCHGCVEDQDAKFSLSSGTREAGADPTKWRNNYAGSLYGETVGTPPEEWSTEARAAYLSRDTVRQELAASKEAGYWADIDPGTLAYLSRGLHDVTADDGRTTEDDRTQVVEEHAGQEPSDPWTTEEGVDVSQPIPPPKHGDQFRLPDPREGREPVSTEEFRKRVADKIDELEAHNVLELNVADMAPLYLESGKGRSTMYDELNRLCDVGRLTKESGKPPYRIKARIRNGSRDGASVG